MGNVCSCSGQYDTGENKKPLPKAKTCVVCMNYFSSEDVHNDDESKVCKNCYENYYKIFKILDTLYIGKSHVVANRNILKRENIQKIIITDK